MKTWRANRRRYLADMHNPEYAHIRFIRLRNRRETEAFIASLSTDGA